MKKVVLTVLKIAGIVLLVMILLIAGFLFWLSRRPFVPNDYTETVETGGALEAKYLAMGPYEVKQVKAEAPEDWKEFVAYYPALFRHLASWGFIVLGNEGDGNRGCNRAYESHGGLNEIQPENVTAICRNRL